MLPVYFLPLLAYANTFDRKYSPLHLLLATTARSIDMRTQQLGRLLTQPLFPNDSKMTGFTLQCCLVPS